MADDLSLGALTAVLDALPQPSVVLGPDALPVFVNSAFRSYLGMREGEDLLQAAQRLIHPDDFGLFWETVDGLRNDRQQVHEVELRLHRHDGQWRWHACTAAPVRMGTGEQLWVVSYQDVDDHRRRGGQLHEAREQADAALALIDAAQASAPVGFAFIDRDFRFQRLNAALAEMDGADIAEHLGRRVEDVVPQLWPQLLPIYERVLAGEVVKEIDIVGETLARPGVRREWKATYFPVRVPPDELVAGIGIVVSEVTEERHLERQLLQAQKMEAVGYLAGGIAHDFNNVLGVVTLTAQSLLPEADSPRMRDGLGRIIAATRSAADLTRSLLVVARREPAHPRPVDVVEAMRQLREVIAGTLPESIKLDVDLAADLPPVFVDPTSLEQVVLNLVINARDAMPDGGWLRISARAGEPDRVTLSVSDNGTGMTEEVLDQAVTPFFTTKQSGTGTGLGLSTVYGIVTALGGELSIASTYGEGTTVDVLLPVAQAVASPAPSDPATPPRGAGQLILLVEDQPVLRAAVTEVLESEGYRVVGAADAAEALARRHEPPALLLTDVVLPGLSGPELARQLHAVSPGMRVLLMSGYPGDVLESRGEGNRWPVLAKPFTMETLLTAVADQLAGEVQAGG